MPLPLPLPQQGEMQEEFIGRCMRDPATRDITGATADEAHQRQMAACFRQWRDGRKGAEENETDVDTKAFGALEIKDAAKGEVRAVVATLNVVDKDGDVLLPGSFPAKARVKVSEYRHDVVLKGAAPVGMGSVTVEGDKAIFNGHYFMSTQRGREAFATVKELGAEGEWSFGFPRQVQTAELSEEWKGKGARRLIAGLKPVEVSPVFVGAGVGTSTLSAKGAEDHDTKFEPPPAGDLPDHLKKILAETYSHCRQEWVDAHPADKENQGNKEHCARIAWTAVHNAQKATAGDVDTKIIKHGHTDCPVDKPWALVSRSTGRLLGCHATEQEALAQERAIQANKAASPEPENPNNDKALQADIDAEYQRFERTRRQLDY